MTKSAKTYWTIYQIEGVDSDNFDCLNTNILKRPYIVLMHPGKGFLKGSFISDKKYYYDNLVALKHELFETEELAFKAYIKALEEKIVSCNEEIDFAKERLLSKYKDLL